MNANLLKHEVNKSTAEQLLRAMPTCEYANSSPVIEIRISAAVIMIYWGTCQRMLTSFAGTTVCTFHINFCKCTHCHHIWIKLWSFFWKGFEQNAAFLFLWMADISNFRIFVHYLLNMPFCNKVPSVSFRSHSKNATEPEILCRNCAIKKTIRISSSFFLIIHEEWASFSIFLFLQTKKTILTYILKYHLKIKARLS